MSPPEAICEKAGRCGVITLNRPHALNALTLNMVRAIADALDRWEDDPAVDRVLIKGAGERAFCAGADIKQLYELGRAGRHAEQLTFWREEYVLNRRIKLYPKPYIALVDGIVMGGGAGVSIHGSHVVAGDALSFAMPEVGIGFFPDIGATYFLPRLAGASGAYLALTGARIGTGDALAFGLASAFAPSCRHPALAQRLIDGEPCEAAIAAESAPAPRAALGDERGVIDACFSGASVTAILERLENAPAGASDFARATAQLIRSRSPTSLAIALRQMRIGASLDIDEAMRTEFRIASRIAMGADFYEGVRAALVDKDRRPAWIPPDVAAVTPSDTEDYFAPLEFGELEFFAGVGRS
ncbi:enoyl-CoA hydratase/isomerase family protein [Methylocapsa palsarum]|uniref:3-hydroxyisobutyryl-CoA hydrolase n=1 Tax=Methylocapsa palsarum TaxID=1612308 RepID=A0A1I3WW20_9HYPH|nr:enoyl-CoA hydratase/isomerase family protein [Methylocapsa palsarum]SFK11738.1 enoyl-CoA hydratase [Methylocapsa palsarum]